MLRHLICLILAGILGGAMGWILRNIRLEGYRRRVQEDLANRDMLVNQIRAELASRGEQNERLHKEIAASHERWSVANTRLDDASQRRAELEESCRALQSLVAQRDQQIKDLTAKVQAGPGFGRK